MMQSKDTQDKSESKRGEGLRANYLQAGHSAADVELMVRVELVTVDALPESKLAWRHACAEWGAGSPGALGWLLQLIRDTYGNARAYVEASAYSHRWSVNTCTRPLRQLAVGETEFEALVSALEEATHAQG